MQAATLTDPCLMPKLAWWVLGAVGQTAASTDVCWRCRHHMSSRPPHASHALLTTRGSTQNALQNYWNKNRQDIKRCTAHLLSGKKDVDWVVSEARHALACKQPGENHRFQSNLLPSLLCRAQFLTVHLPRPEQGMAWEGVLCGWYGSKGDNWAYGFTSNLEGDFAWSGVQVGAGRGRC